MSKLIQLDQAIARHVKPGMAVHLTTQARAGTRALQRVFQGQPMDLTLIVGRVGGSWSADLLNSGLVKHVISGSYGMVSRNYTGRLRQVEAVYASGEVTFQHWSFWSLMQRLIAAAHGFPYGLTHSLSGSTLAEGNPDYLEVIDPFDASRKVAAVRALHPDIAIVHVDAADEDGNAILLPPSEEGFWGAKASRSGVIVMAERIVDHNFIHQHAHLVRLPARYVRAVCHVPFGAHPGAFGHADLEGFDVYREDHEFSDAYVEATRDPDKLSAWVDYWITGVKGQEGYLERLGASRLASLRERNPGPKSALAANAPQCYKPANDNEILMTLAMREVIKRTAESGCDVFLVGAGLSEVPATAAYSMLKQQGIEVSLTMGHGYYGFEPQPGRTETEPSTARMNTDTPEIYGVVLGGRLGRTLAILGTAQVDRWGNLNSTLIDGRLLIGSGGSNDASSMCQTLVVIRSGRRKLVKLVEYATCSGRNVRTVITEQGVFEKVGDAQTLSLVSYVDREGQGRDKSVQAIAQECGWELEVSPTLQPAPLPSSQELELVRSLMPKRYA